MPGELVVLQGQLYGHFRANREYLGRVEAYLKDKDEVSNSTRAVLFDRIAADFVDAVRFLNVAGDAVTWLINNGEWFSNLNIQDLIYTLRDEIAQLSDRVANNVTDNTAFIISKIDEVLSDVRFALFPEFAFLEDLIRREISGLNYVLNKSLNDTKNAITADLTPKIESVSRSVDNLENTIVESGQSTVGQIDTSVKETEGVIVSSIESSENSISDKLGVATGLISQGIIQARVEVENTFLNTMEALKKAFVTLSDDIAKRIWEYFRDFVFEKV